MRAQSTPDDASALSHMKPTVIKEAERALGSGSGASGWPPMPAGRSLGG
jgi:hypothetical protein